LQGYLRGFIDLVFEQQGRFHVLDWKSNHLGNHPADYAAAPLARAMAAHGYELQALLYTVALHRHLSRRLPGYRYEKHFGGAYYLFVRGVRPGWVEGGVHTGVHVLRPPLALVERLSAMFQPRGGTGFNAGSSSGLAMEAGG
jgi:exodeoxyribonuclease V beta subunit